MRYFQWNKEKLFERYTEAPDKGMKSAGLKSTLDDDHQQPSSSSSTATSNSLPLKRVKHQYTCEICFDDDADMEFTALGCGHHFCNTCYEHYLRQKILEEGESRRIQCPQDKCHMVVDESTVSRLVDTKTKLRYIYIYYSF